MTTELCHYSYKFMHTTTKTITQLHRHGHYSGDLLFREFVLGLKLGLGLVYYTVLANIWEQQIFGIVGLNLFSLGGKTSWILSTVCYNQPKTLHWKGSAFSMHICYCVLSFSPLLLRVDAIYWKVADLHDSGSQTTTDCGRGSLVAICGQTRTENYRICTSLFNTFSVVPEFSVINRIY